jgi:hypothetical protein
MNYPFESYFFSGLNETIVPNKVRFKYVPGPICILDSLDLFF